MGCAVYDDGSSYCEDESGWTYSDPDGVLYYGYYDQSGSPDLSTVTDAIQNTLIGIFGTHGYPPANSPGTIIRPGGPGSIPTGVTGLPSSHPSSGINISTNTLMLIVGGVILFMLGSQSKGRR